jgi:hypothetical protein
MSTLVPLKSAQYEAANRQGLLLLQTNVPIAREVCVAIHVISFPSDPCQLLPCMCLKHRLPYSAVGRTASRSLCAYSAYWMVTNMGPVENMTVTYLDKCVRKDCSEYHALAEENNMALLTLAVAYNRDGCTGYIGISAMHHGGIIVLGGRKHGAVKIKAVMVLGGCQTNLQQSRKECLCGGCGPQTQEPRSCA